MAVPDFQSLMLPIMQLARDEQVHTLSNTVDLLAKEFNLSEEERKEMLPSGRQTRFANRIGWALTHLRKAGVLVSVSRGKYKITARGKSALAQNPPKIDLKFLNQYPEHVAFRTSSKPSTSSSTNTDDETSTPEEVLESSYLELRQNLGQEIIDIVKSCSPSFFENLVIDLLVAMGYGGSKQDAATVGRSGDGGIDGTIKEDKLGLDVVYVQAKRWEGTVGRPVVQAFAGSLEGVRARKGVLITTSDFSKAAFDYVERIEKKIVLINGKQLSEFMIDHNIGVSEEATYTIKKLDSDYFESD